jgi:hypothetical protein
MQVWRFLVIRDLKIKDAQECGTAKRGTKL